MYMYLVEFWSQQWNYLPRVGKGWWLVTEVVVGRLASHSVCQDKRSQMVNWSPFPSIINLKYFILIPEIGHKTYSAFEQKQKILSAKHNQIVAFFVQQNPTVATT